MPNIAGWTNAIFRDTTGNGVLEIGEGSSPLVGWCGSQSGRSGLPGHRQYPGDSAVQCADFITVTATFTPAMGTMITYSRQDVTTVGAAGGAGLTLMKSVRNITQGGVAGTSNTAKPGDTLEYVITFSNSNQHTRDDGGDFRQHARIHELCLCVVRHAAPAALNACSVTTQPMVGNGGNVQWTLMGQLNAAQSGTVVFRVAVQ